MDQRDMAKRIESEAQSISSPTNNDLVCRDCLFRYPDDIYLGNTSKCEIFPDMKPVEVLFDGKKCKKYLKE